MATFKTFSNLIFRLVFCGSIFFSIQSVIAAYISHDTPDISQVLYSIQPVLTDLKEFDGEVNVGIQYSDRYQALNPAHHYQIEFDPTQIQLRSFTHDQQQVMSLKLIGWGYSGYLQSPLNAKPVASSHDRIEYHRGPLTEWYVNNPSGLEQGFTLHTPPPVTLNSHQNNLEVRLAISGDFLSPDLKQDKQSITLKSPNGQFLEYSGLYAYDATGRKLPSEMFVENNIVGLRVNDKDATYPIVIDPKFHRGDDGNKQDWYGYSVAIDGDTFVVGAPFYIYHPLDSYKRYGAAFIYRKDANNTNGWSFKQAFFGTQSGMRYGWSVSLHSNTMVVGSISYVGTKGDSPSLSEGAVYVFSRTNQTAGFKHQQILHASDSQKGDGGFQDPDMFGYAVDVDNDRIIVGSPFVHAAAYLFLRNSSNTWYEKTKVTSTSPTSPNYPPVYRNAFGKSVAIADGIFVVGAECQNYVEIIDNNNNLIDAPNGPGAAYVYSYPLFGTNWTLETVLSTSNITHSAVSRRFGASVDIKRTRYETFSGGNTVYTVVVGMPDNHINAQYVPIQTAGAAFVFERSKPTFSPFVAPSWTLTQKLTASDQADWKRELFGESVAVSPQRIVVGTPGATGPGGWGVGAAYIFMWNKNNSGKWDQVAKEQFNAVASDYLGWSVGVEGTTGIFGAPLDDVIHSDTTNFVDQGSVFIKSLNYLFPSF